MARLVQLMDENGRRHVFLNGVEISDCLREYRINAIANEPVMAELTLYVTFEPTIEDAYAIAETLEKAGTKSGTQMTIEEMRKAIEELSRTYKKR